MQQGISSPRAIERIATGKYTIHQTEAPKGYFEAKDKEIEIKNVEETQKYEILNKKKKVNYSVEKTLKSITLNGQNIEITNNKLVKLEIPTKEIKNTELIARYSIKVENKGEIEGKVKVLETIPEGCEIVEATEWKKRGDGKLEAEIELKEGETKEIGIELRWKNNEGNLGAKTNKAEIESEEEDQNKEDDKSEATIIINIKTGVTQIITILLIITTIGICGITCVYVLGRI